MSRVAVNACNFHPMRGHVEDGSVVRFSDGQSLTVRSVGSCSWGLFNAAGQRIGRVADGAYDLTRLVLDLEDVGAKPASNA